MEFLLGPAKEGQRVLHAGCAGNPLPDWLKGYKETRLDINAAYQPDVVASMANMGEIGRFEAIWCSHTLEHLHPYDVEKAMREFYRVLSPGGFALICVPDLEDAKPTNEKVYDSMEGPITGLDLFYGMSKLVAEVPYMAHYTGFIAETLKGAMEAAGFENVITKRSFPYQLMAIGIRPRIALQEAA